VFQIDKGTNYTKIMTALCHQKKEMINYFLNECQLYARRKEYLQIIEGRITN